VEDILAAGRRAIPRAVVDIPAGGRLAIPRAVVVVAADSLAAAVVVAADSLAAAVVVAPPMLAAVGPAEAVAGDRTDRVTALRPLCLNDATKHRPQGDDFLRKPLPCGHHFPGSYRE
jgi:hypothetical protein